MSYVVISPVRNEEQYLGQTIQCMAAQTARPLLWLLIDDGSTDCTRRIIDDAAAQYPWLKALHRKDRGFRQAGGGVMEAFYDGYALLPTLKLQPPITPWKFLVKFDGDLSFSSDYFEQCFQHFAGDPTLGIGGGTICNQVEGALRIESRVDPAFHVRGATKIYRRECWDQIGGLIRAPGWDTVDEVKANMLGWTTRTFPDLKLVHHRPAGRAYGQWSNLLKNGRANYVAGYHPLFMFLKCVRRLFERPYLLEGCGLWLGFLGGYLRAVPQVPDKQVIKYFRRQQINRMLGKKEPLDLIGAMGDFFLDFRDSALRAQSAARAASLFAFTEDTRIETIERGPFSLLLAGVDEGKLWSPYERRSTEGNLMVALAGRIAFEEEEWERAGRVGERGGLACKAIAEKYDQGGLGALTSLNGNFVVFIHDERKKKFFLITDRCGMFLAYGKGPASNSLIFGSHPDVLADIAGESQHLDLASLAEFLMTSRLTFPYTYYKNICPLAPASIICLDLQLGHAVYESQTQYFQLAFRIDPHADANDLAERLSVALKNAVRRRTLPLFGCTGVGLSGGLDSRAIISAADPRALTRAFTLFDEENAEFSTAKAIAAACRIEMVPIKRDFDYYANSAELGVRVSGGTGCITCNHFLGARERLKAAGIENILTGCYCDYLFKGLAFNRREQFFSRNEALNGFQFEFYDSFHWLKTPWRDEVMARLEAQFPESARPQLSETDWLEVERKRVFPLAYEQDLAQRVIPQRLMSWFIPAADNDLIDAYLSIPPRFKLNGTVFKKMLPLICRDEICAIPDNNTGSRLNATWPGYALARCASSLRNRLTERFQPRMSTSGSWPNWRYYLSQSQSFNALWNRPNPAARELLVTILGKDPYQMDIREYAAQDLVLFQRLVTLKLWLDQRMA